MVLDECPKLTMDKKIISKAIDISTDWAKRSKKAFGTNLNKSLFGIVQGGKFKDLRTKSINQLLKIGFDGYAIGGLPVGESQNVMFEVLDNLVDDIPKDKPIYLMEGDVLEGGADPATADIFISYEVIDDA